MCIGGLTPLLASQLVSVNHFSPAYYIAVVGVVGMVAPMLSTVPQIKVAYVPEDAAA